MWKRDFQPIILLNAWHLLLCRLAEVLSSIVCATSSREAQDCNFRQLTNS